MNESVWYTTSIMTINTLIPGVNNDRWWVWGHSASEVCYKGQNRLYSDIQATVKHWLIGWLTCLPCLFLHEIQRLPSRLYLILYIWANSLPMPPAWRPWVPTRVMKWSERRSIWRNSFRLSGSTVVSGHHAPSPSSKSSLGEGREDEIAEVDVHIRITAGKGKEKLWQNGEEKVRGKQKWVQWWISVLTACYKNTSWQPTS